MAACPSCISYLFYSLKTALHIAYNLVVFFTTRVLSPSDQPDGLSEVLDPITHRKRIRRYDGSFAKGRHDGFYLFGGHSTCANAVFVSSKVALDSVVVLKALEYLASTYPLLRVKAEWETTKDGLPARYLTEIDGFSFREINFSEHDAHASDWKGLFEEDLNAGFDLSGGRPLWRVTRLLEQFTPADKLYSNTFIMTFHHSIFDGSSMMKFLGEFQEKLHQFHRGVPMSSPLSSPMSPPLLELLKQHIELPWYGALWYQIKHVLRKGREPPRNVFLAKYPPPVLNNEEDFKTKTIPGILSDKLTSSLVQKCKLNGSTVGGALSAAVAIATGQLIQDSISHCAPGEFVIGLPVNIRGACNLTQEDQEFGLFISVIFIPCKLPFVGNISDIFWSVAAEMTSRVKQKLKQEKQFEFLKKLKYTPRDVAQDITSASADIRNAGRFPNIFEVSNRGRFSYPCVQDYHVTGCHNAVAQHLIGPVMTLTAMSINGRLHWTFVYSSRTMRDALAREFARSVGEILKDITSC
ncbi:uncharacterized protein LOC116610902 [Nematostella vectensis]|uniref:uncharacterized protein LOC116610902 n=1 Tax=Nematostella vectensis TaxID=45351 RepID=UPI0020778A64|nr:uncharacterized protein LOC116610902 [Nematostella vectensis]